MNGVELTLLLGGTALAAVGVAVFQARRRAARRRQLMTAPIPDTWVEILERNLPPYAWLSADERERLHGCIQVFLDEKAFEGCGGQEVDDDVRVTIAAEACLLLLNRPARVYPGLRTILVYPQGYVAREPGLGGETSSRLGESWGHGTVVLAWNSVRRGGLNFDDGHNVAIHEFAHQLDQASGAGDGAPILSERSAYRSWARVLRRDFEKLQAKAKRGKRDVMDRYGATNPAEFFAVATETFFEKPRQLHKKHPELFEELKLYYRTDPLVWEKAR